MSQPLASMTGYARAAGAAAGCTFAVEIKSVNARGLDIRMRLPAGLDALEPRLRALISDALDRGAVNCTLTLQGQAGRTRVNVNRQALDEVLSAIDDLSTRIDAQKPSLDGILGLKGVLEAEEAGVSEEDEDALFAGIEGAARDCLESLLTVRRQEGAHLVATLGGHIDEIGRLTEAAESHPARTREAIAARLAEQVAELADNAAGLNQDRLHQEALVLATKADIREELDRLAAHVGAARALLAEGGAVGRRLDFLAQEFNREANTLCSKSNDVSLTAIGLDLKAVIDQLREQIQNLE